MCMFTIHFHKYIILTLLLIVQPLLAQPQIVENFDCIKVAGKTYTGSPNSNGYYNHDGIITYKFKDAIVMRGLSDDSVYERAHKVTIWHWNSKSGKFKPSNVMGAIKKAKKAFPSWKKKEKKRVKKTVAKEKSVSD